VQSFRAWKAKFDLELAAKKAHEDEEKMKALSPKEREEWRRAATRLSGQFYDPRVDDKPTIYLFQAVNYSNATEFWKRIHSWKKEPSR
jgi:hypothetical protein